MPRTSKLSLSRSSSSKESREVRRNVDVTFDSPNRSSTAGSPNGTPINRYSSDDPYETSPMSMTQRAHNIGIDVTWGDPTTPVRSHKTSIRRSRTMGSEVNDFLAKISPKATPVEKPLAGPKGIYKFIHELKMSKIYFNSSKHSNDEDSTMEQESNVNKDKEKDNQTNDQNDGNVSPPQPERSASSDNSNEQITVIETDKWSVEAVASSEEESNDIGQTDNFNINNNNNNNNNNNDNNTNHLNDNMFTNTRRDSMDDYLCALDDDGIISISSTSPNQKDFDDSLDDVLCTIDDKNLNKSNKNNFGRYNSMPVNATSTTATASGLIGNQKNPTEGSSGFSEYLTANDKIESLKSSNEENYSINQTEPALNSSFKKQKSMPIAQTFTATTTCRQPLSSTMKKLIEQNRLKALELRKKSQMTKKLFGRKK